MPSWCRKCDAVIAPIDVEIDDRYCPRCRPRGWNCKLALAHWQERFSRVELLPNRTELGPRTAPRNHET